MRNNNLWFRLAIALPVIILVAVLFIVLHSGRDWQYTKATSNLQNSWLSDDSLYFYSGTLFARYNLQTNHVDQLSAYLDIHAGISAVSWSRDSVIFQANPAQSDRDDVVTAAENLGVDPFSPHWWRYNFQDKQYQLLYFSDIDSCTSLIQIDSDSLACASPDATDSTTTHLQVFSIANHTSATLATSQDTLGSLASDGKNLYYIQTSLGGTESLRSVDFLGANQKEVYHGKGQILFDVTQDGSVAIDDALQKSGSELSNGSFEQNSLPKKASHIITLFNSHQIFSKQLKLAPVTFYDKGGTPQISTLDGAFYSLTNGGLQKNPKAHYHQLANGDFQFTNGGRYYILQSNNTLLAYPGISQPKNYRDSSTFTYNDNDSSGNSYIDNAQSGVRDSALYLSDDSFSDQAQSMGDRLSKQGFRPTEFNFNWLVDGPDFHTPISPNAIIIK